MNTVIDIIKIIDDILFIKKEFKVDPSIEDMYIFLEHALTTLFYDIYNEQINDKLLTKQQYVDVITQMLKKNNVKHIFFIDNNEDSTYYIELDDDNSLSIFTEEISNTVFK